MKFVFAQVASWLTRWPASCCRWICFMRACVFCGVFEALFLSRGTRELDRNAVLWLLFCSCVLFCGVCEMLFILVIKITFWARDRQTRCGSFRPAWWINRGYRLVWIEPWTRRFYAWNIWIPSNNQSGPKCVKFEIVVLLRPENRSELCFPLQPLCRCAKTPQVQYIFREIKFTPFRYVW